MQFFEQQALARRRTTLLVVLFAASIALTVFVIIVTRGALASLERDELQGVVAHEMSHVLNGDVRLNTWMIGLLAGLVSVGALGGFLLSGNDPESDAPKDARMLMARAALGMPFAILGGIALFLLGIVLAILGGAGLLFARLIKATVSREREFLADASAVQFTRNPEGLAGALARIEGHRFGSRLQEERIAEALHDAQPRVPHEGMLALDGALGANAVAVDCPLPPLAIAQ